MVPTTGSGSPVSSRDAALASTDLRQPRRASGRLPDVSRVTFRAGALATAAVLMVLAGPAAVPSATAGDTALATAKAAYARMTGAQRIGQLLMAAVPSTGSSSSLRTKLSRYHVGNVILIGQTYAGADAVAHVVAPVRRVTTEAGVLPYVAVDQEGGEVQHLKGSGFSTIPTALRQGGIAPTTLRSDWLRWARQLRRAAVNLDLAPVADVVPSSIGTANQPIGRYHREYGYTTSVVAPHVAAVVRGVRDAGLSTTVKHFPGLGRATGNTDTTAGVTDPTRRGDALLGSFQRAVNAGAPMVMVSTAIYPNIAPHVIGAFSHLVVTTMLRHDLGFTGVIVSDSLTAKSVSAYTYAARAVLSLDAGVDILLFTDNAAVGPMSSAIASRAEGDAAFASVVKTAVMRVLTAKARAGLIP
jgi:beta-N-acetylhexosaminidase